MKLIINGETQVCEAVTLAELLHVLEYEGDWLATAVNGDLVHREDRAGHLLDDGDRIEILSPMQGG
ncbi:sulfur carrier protein ThiS [Rhizobium beringeri]|jgi:sulfur carrier protein|uniref:Sulfur carrier protein ThiS n=2 Tax=Rhizobium TaxID=379 RepID=A0A444I6W5_RHILE|nr:MULTISPECIES: sulfur carrier protein ThiS [Rhizobium]NKL67245.1 sulfur carrier protein ThiS [Rhizobium leguminosarum bv. viciae]MBY5460668.1 sulfur carrier protein ThiS [Rhizobium leguminosarum]RWX33952.1 sulfur carrier protein ThiS [Rhizobium leguminosarum]TAU37898.1 sulfur carrier protein ThiS [Rhizobium leguminosarum]TBC54822.1 sulfur carrier protein ThiS [Rhizobium leguminosarum]